MNVTWYHVSRVSWSGRCYGDPSLHSRCMGSIDNHTARNRVNKLAVCVCVCVLFSEQTECSESLSASPLLSLCRQCGRAGDRRASQWFFFGAKQSVEMASGQSLILPPEWQRTNKRVLNQAQADLQESSRLRQDAEALRNTIASRIANATAEVDRSLTRRINEVQDKRTALEQSSKATTAEIAALEVIKGRLEQALAAKKHPLDVAHQCLENRLGRIGIDRVRDCVETELEVELEVIKSAAGLINQKLNESIDRLRTLKAARYELEHDSGNKGKTLEIDGACATSDKTLRTVSKLITLEPSPVQPPTYENFTERNLAAAEQERALSSILRDVANDVLAMTARNVHHQRDIVNREFEERIAQIADAKAALEISLKENEEEIASLEHAIEELKIAIQEKEFPMAVATGRLNRRVNRNGVELVHDHVEINLTGEVALIDRSIKELKASLAQAERDLLALRRTRVTLEEDIRVKTVSLSIDNKCVDLRRSLQDQTF